MHHNAFECGQHPTPEVDALASLWDWLESKSRVEPPSALFHVWMGLTDMMAFL